MLPQKLYEAIRWIIAIALPAIGLLLTNLSSIWGWENFPAVAISSTLDALGLFLGGIFGISKVMHDKEAE